MVLNPQTHTKTHSTLRFHRHVDESSEKLTIFLFVRRKHFFVCMRSKKSVFLWAWESIVRICAKLHGSATR